MKDNETLKLPPLVYEGGTKAMTLTPIIGTPKREYAEVFVPGVVAAEMIQLKRIASYKAGGYYE